ncbi:MAG: hypothetical protein Ta2D_13540 [Rickettsiales bacterium]|nr:MAG: hypothetical protein Ta2D_13540 [Rickettsiales bacterium]
MLKVVFLFIMVFSISFADETPHYFVREEFEDKFFDKKTMEDGSVFYGKIISADGKTIWYNRQIWDDGRAFTEKIEMDNGTEYYNIRTIPKQGEIAEKVIEGGEIKIERVLLVDGTETIKEMIIQNKDGEEEGHLYNIKNTPTGHLSVEKAVDLKKGITHYNKEGRNIERTEYKNGDMFYNISKDKEGNYIAEKCKINGIAKTKCILPE